MHCTAIAALVLGVLARAERPKNVLLVVVDDLFAVDHVPQDLMPNLHAFANKATEFRNAHAQFSICGPSRNSFMSGVAPARILDDFKEINIAFTLETFCKSRVYYQHPVTGEHTGIETMNEYFVRSGMDTFGIGKVFHFSKPPKLDVSPGGKCPQRACWPNGKVIECADENGMVDLEGRPRWSAPHYIDLEGKRRWLMENGITTSSKGGPLYQFIDPEQATKGRETERSFYADTNYTETSVERIKSFAGKTAPWFIAVGLTKPHKPMYCPKRFWELAKRFHYSSASTRGDGNPIYELLRRREVCTSAHSSERLAEGYPSEIDYAQIRTAYHACVSYADDLFGKLLRALRDSGQEDNTVVVFMSDHGYHLGEHQERYDAHLPSGEATRCAQAFGKSTVLDVSTRVPLYVYVPGTERTAPRVNFSPVELLDVFPTLIEATGIRDFNGGRDPPQYLDGTSLMPILDGTTEWVKPYARTMWLRHRSVPGHNSAYALRTTHHRLVQHVDDGVMPGNGGRDVFTDWPTMQRKFLFDYERDPEELQDYYVKPRGKKLTRRVKAKLEKRLDMDLLMENGARPIDYRVKQLHGNFAAFGGYVAEPFTRAAEEGASIGDVERTLTADNGSGLRNGTMTWR